MSYHHRHTAEQLNLLIAFVREGSEFNELRAAEVERQNRVKTRAAASREWTFAF
jgi:hypothetical protein